MTGDRGLITILGARGMLGSDLAAECRRSGFEVRALDLPELDITDRRQLKEALRGSEIIVNCAAYTDVEKAQSQESAAYAVNAEAVGHLGELAKGAGAQVVHISTDFVFDGRLERPYVETDEPNPLGAYGRTKLAGERLLAESGCEFTIIRVQWTYGTGGNNFVSKMLAAAGRGGALKVVDDQVGSPTATTEVAGAICELLKRRPCRAGGILHFAAGGYVSRYDMARFIFDRMGMEVEVNRCKTNEFASAAERPLNSRFNCEKIERLLGRGIEGWQGALARFLEQL